MTMASTATAVYASHEATELRGRFVTRDRGSVVELWWLRGPLRWITEVVHSCREVVVVCVCVCVCVCDVYIMCVRCIHCVCGVCMLCVRMCGGEGV